MNMENDGTIENFIILSCMFIPLSIYTYAYIVEAGTSKK